MNEQCKLKSVSILTLKPRWVEFTSTKGVLRVTQPMEPPEKIQGMVFTCPRCKGNKKKEHYNIFLFPNSPEEARPQGRFVLDLFHHSKTVLESQSFEKTCLYQLNPTGGAAMLLKPQDICGWEGYLMEGQVSWRPNFMERLWK